MPGTPTIVCVGIAVLDRVFRVPALAVGPGKYRATDRQVVGGGVAANAAVTIARLGGAARFLGVVGDDPAGSEIVAGLAAEDVDVAGIRSVVGHSPESIVQVDEDGERLIVNHASLDLFERANPVRPEEIDGAEAVLVDMRWPGGAIPALVAAADRGVPGIVDCDHDPAAAPGLLESASHVIFARDTLLAHTNIDDIETALRAVDSELPAWSAVTAGAEGTYWLVGGELAHEPAVVVEAVDTLGAGDVFHGAFALAHARGYALRGTIAFASAVAALKCTRFGGRSGIPTQHELDTFLEQR